MVLSKGVSDLIVFFRLDPHDGPRLAIFRGRHEAQSHRFLRSLRDRRQTEALLLTLGIGHFCCFHPKRCIPSDLDVVWPDLDSTHCLVLVADPQSPKRFLRLMKDHSKANIKVS